MSNSNGDSVSYYVIITDRKRRRKDKPFDEPEDKFTAFATNTSWINMLKYGKRWGIETGFRMIENVGSQDIQRQRRRESVLLSILGDGIQPVGGCQCDPHAGRQMGREVRPIPRSVWGEHLGDHAQQSTGAGTASLVEAKKVHLR